MLNTVLVKCLKHHNDAGLYRKRFILEQFDEITAYSQGKFYTAFTSNNYLGLAKHPDVIKAYQLGAEKYGVGSGSSSLVAGYQLPHQALEDAFANFLQRKKSLLFVSGYMANIGVMQALVKKHDIIFADKYNHASLIDASLLTKAKLKRYPHGNIGNLQAQLISPIQGQKIIVTDSVFSMQGDIAPLPQLAQLAKNNNAWLMVDDAHGIGILGNEGRGTLSHFNLGQQDVPILIIPLGKAFGCAGAIVAGDEYLIESLIQFARTYIYTTAMPPALACALLKSLAIIQQDTWRREKLQYLIRYFKQGARQRNLIFLPSDTPIQSLVTGDTKQTLFLQQALLAKGILVSAIRPPTVPANTARIRITLSCLHQEHHIDQLLDYLAAYYVNIL